MTGGLSWGWTTSPGPYSCPCCDCIVSQACGNHRAWEGSYASQVHPKPTLSRLPLAPGLLVAPLPAFPPPLSYAALCELKLLGCALAQSQRRCLREASCPGSLPSLGSSEIFSGVVLGSFCCQRPEGPSHFGGPLAVGPALLPAPFPSQEVQCPAPENQDSVNGLPASANLEFMKRQLLT